MSLRVRRHYKLFVLLALVAAVTALGLGNYRIIAYTFQGGEQVPGQGTGCGRDGVVFAATTAVRSGEAIAGTHVASRPQIGNPLGCPVGARRPQARE